MTSSQDPSTGEYPPGDFRIPHPINSTNQSNRYQLTQAQLSPAMEHRVTATAESQQTSQRLGFALTSRLAQSHASQPFKSRPLFQFQVTKLRSWRTGYLRILACYETEFVTFDPHDERETNRWSYAVLTEWLAVPNEQETILLQVDRDNLKFTCHYVPRAAVLTNLLQCRDNAGYSSHVVPFAHCERFTRHGTVVPVALHVKPFGLEERDGQTNLVVQLYRWIDIAGVSFTAQNESGIIFYFHNTYKSRLYFIYTARQNGSGRSDLLTCINGHAETLGLTLNMNSSCTVEKWLENRRSTAKASTPVTTWPVTKITRRHDIRYVGSDRGWAGGIVARQLVITGDGLLVERDGGAIIAAISLHELATIVRMEDQIMLEFADGNTRIYTCTCQDALVVSMLDAAATLAKNENVHLLDTSSKGYVFGRPSIPAPEKPSIFQPVPIPMYCLKKLHTRTTATYAFLSREFEHFQPGQPINLLEETKAVVEACREFNACVPPTADGLPTGNSDKTISGCIGAIWGIITKLLERGNGDDSRDRQLREMTAGALMQALYRLSKTNSGYRMSVELDTLQESIPFLWDIRDVFCKFWTMQVLNVLLSGLPQQRDMEAEYINKSVVLKAGGQRLVDGLVSALVTPAIYRPSDGNQQVSDLILMVTSDLLQSILCSYHDTTNPEHFSAFINALSERYRALLSILRSQTPFVIENTALLLHLLSTHAPAAAVAIRDAALSSAILLQHFHAAIFSPLEGQRFLSRYLCSLWMSGPMDCDEKRLLKRMVPHGFLAFLRMPPLSKVEKEQLDEIERDAIEESIPENAYKEGLAIASRSLNQESAAGTNTARLRSRVSIAAATASGNSVSPKENFRIFFHVLTQDHSLPDLIWSQQTRRELRIALENEIQYIKRETEARGMDAFAWNHQQFRVFYPSLDNEIKVGNVYMRLWLQAGEGFIRSWDEPLRLFEVLFRRFLCEIDRDTKVTVMCIRCLEKLYAVHASKIGPFTDVMILVRSMAFTKNIETQHRLLELLATLLGVSKDEMSDNAVEVPENAEQLLNDESIGQLCQFVAWGHTNSDQIGNILTRALSASSKMKGMITNGPIDKLQEQDVHKENVKEAPDHFCPPVWFVAATSKIPPPSDVVKGPYRVSDLIEMVNNDDLSPFDLVTSSHVEEYDVYEHAQSVKEEQIDTGKWKRLNEVWQLRWQLCTDRGSDGIFSPAYVALQAVRGLTRLVDLHKSLDSRNVPYFPMPIAKRILCGLNRDVSEHGGRSSNPLSILTQALLCNDSRVVLSAAELLDKLMLYNDEATPKFYLTGVYYFALGHTGSNFKAIAKMLYDTHLKQNFRSGFAAAAAEDELSMKDRSILGNLLPEGILFILVNYGPERFAEVFVGDADTPEVIWTLEMRKHLIEMIMQHLGDFPLRLFQNTTIEYEYCPMPGVAYKRLAKEIFCHSYYLHNLCNEERFPDWPIADPVEVFRACLERFKKQIDLDEADEEDKLEDARRILDLKPGDGSKELRKTYRSLARKFHPDKNPAGRKMFELIQSSYERLLPLVENGDTIRQYTGGETLSESHKLSTDSLEGFPGGQDQMQTMHLLVKTQLLIYRRYEKQMSRYKYPAYNVLLWCVEVPHSCREAVRTDDTNAILATCLASSNRANFILTCVDLLFRTCLISPMNSEELVAESGVRTLASLLRYYVRLSISISRKTAEDNNLPTSSLVSSTVVIDIISRVLHTIAGIAFYDSGRSAIRSLDDDYDFFSIWHWCLLGAIDVQENKTVLMKRYAVEGVVNMARDATLQEKLVQSGVMWRLMHFTLGFDPTLDDKYHTNDETDDSSLLIASVNSLARQSVRALGMLSGALADAPANENLDRTLKILFTAPIARMLRNKRTGEILRILNSNVEKPDVIWNVNMRKQLESFLTKVEKNRREGLSETVDEEIRVTSDFEYDSLRDELQIDGIYIRVFNKNGKGSIQSLYDPISFAEALVRAITVTLVESDTMAGLGAVPLPEDYLKSEGGNDAKIGIDDVRFLSLLDAFKLLTCVDGLMDDFIERCQHLPSVLLSLLDLPMDSHAFDSACEILSMLSNKQGFADAIAKQRALWRLLTILERPERTEKNQDDSIETADQQKLSKQKVRAWAILEALSSSPSIASLLLTSSGWVELLGVLVGYAKFTKVWNARLGAAKTLSRLLWDSTTGTVADSLLHRYLPSTLIVRLKEEPENMIRSFDGSFDNPELIWGSAMRGELRKVLGSHIEKYVQKGTARLCNIDFPADFRVRYSMLEDELYIGGVYVSRFLKEPTFKLRDPTTFLELLLQRWATEMEKYGKSSPETMHTDTSMMTHTGQDTLELVTTAIVYICKTRNTLCDKLSQWGYIARALKLFAEVLERDLTGVPLLSIIRLLHVGSNSISNVEALAIVGESDGKGGLVDLVQKAIGSGVLHKDASFMIELLKKVYLLALGDLNKARNDGIEAASSSFSPRMVMSPSPAPGDGPVRKRVTMGDDPLGMLPTTQDMPSQTSTNNAPIEQHSTFPFTHPAIISQPQQNFQNPSVVGAQKSRTFHSTVSPEPREDGLQISHQRSFVERSQKYQTQGYNYVYGHDKNHHVPPAEYSYVAHQQSQSLDDYSCMMQQQQRIPTSLAATISATPKNYGQSLHHPQSFEERSRMMQQQQQRMPTSSGPAAPATPQSYVQSLHQPQPFAERSRMKQQQQQQQQRIPISSSATTTPTEQNYTQRFAQNESSGAYSNPNESHHHHQAHLTVSQDRGYPYEQPKTRYGETLSQRKRDQPSPTSAHISGYDSTSYQARATDMQPEPTPSTFIQQSVHDKYDEQSYFIHARRQQVAAPADGTKVSDPYQPNPPNTIGSYHSYQRSDDAYARGLVDTSEEQKSSRSEAIHGTGIDARSQQDPTLVAEQRARSLGGAPGSAHGRVALLQQALSCKLCEFLVNDVLENATLSQLKDPAAAKVHTIELLKLLTKDPGYGPKFKLILDALPAWKKYKSQDHSLFITGHEQRASDNLLTDGTSGETKLLTQS